MSWEPAVWLGQKQSCVDKSDQWFSRSHQLCALGNWELGPFLIGKTTPETCARNSWSVRMHARRIVTKKKDQRPIHFGTHLAHERQSSVCSLVALLPKSLIFWNQLSGSKCTTKEFSRHVKQNKNQDTHRLKCSCWLNWDVEFYPTFSFQPTWIHVSTIFVHIETVYHACLSTDSTNSLINPSQSFCTGRLPPFCALSNVLPRLIQLFTTSAAIRQVPQLWCRLLTLCVGNALDGHQAALERTHAFAGHWLCRVCPCDDQPPDRRTTHEGHRLCMRSSLEPASQHFQYICLLINVSHSQRHPQLVSEVPFVGWWRRCEMFNSFWLLYNVAPHKNMLADGGSS